MEKDNNNIKQFSKKKKESIFDEFTRKRANLKINKFMWITGGIAVALFLLIVGFIISRVYLANKEYTSVSVVDEVKFFISTGSEVDRFGNNFIVYNSDGIKCVNTKGEQIWNEAFQMQKPLVDIGKNIVAVADYNGTTIFLMDDKAVLGRIDTGLPIRKFKAASSGYVMAVLDNTNNTPIYVYDTSGKEMLYFNTTMKGYGYPLEIALSENGILGAVSYLNVDKGSFNSTVGFYNFGEVGQNYQDSLMSSYTYQSTLVPEMRFSASDKAVAIADNRLMFYAGDQMPKSAGEILLSEKLLSVYEDDNYVALFYNSDNEEYEYKAEIYDYSAKLKDTVYYNIEYNDVFFDGDRFILYNNNEILIHNIGGKDKFMGNVEETILAMLPTSSSKKMILITPDEIKTVEFN